MKINKVLAIAINEYEYENLINLNNCRKDLSDIIKLLSEKYVFDEFEYLSEKSQTTRSALFNKLNSYFRNAHDDENILLIYAGHGDYDEVLNSSFWQPSDCSRDDPSTWLNINDILNFIKISNAHHIAIISDSCFAGAIFENKSRGGGISAYDSKKSRLAITSGGIEKVSDGKLGENSPFANIVLNILRENSLIDLPFISFADNVIRNFDLGRKQTPQFGSLSAVGHDGGSFVFKLKDSNKVISEKSKYLQSELGNLYIELSEEILFEVNKLGDLIELKNDTVKKQKYEDAARIRDEEKKIIKNTKENAVKLLANLMPVIESKIIQESKDLDIKIDDYLKNKKTRDEKKTNIGLNYRFAAMEFLYLFLDYDDPAKIKFNKNKNTLFEELNKDILAMFIFFKKMIGVSKSDYFREKDLGLNNILTSIIELEIDLITNNYKNKLDYAIVKKKIEIDLLSWIKG